MSNKTPAQFKKRRYAYFWISLACYFVPYVAATACLLPFMVESAGLKWGIGLAVVFVNALPFVGGVLRHLFSHVPFINCHISLWILFSGREKFCTLPALLAFYSLKR